MKTSYYYDGVNRCRACNRPLKDSTAVYGPVCILRQHLPQNVSIAPNERSEDVRRIQRQLNEMGYTDQDGKNLATDGYYGPKTLDTLLSFMQNNHLPDSEEGEVNMDIWQAIFGESFYMPMPKGEDPSKYFSYSPDVYDEKVAELQDVLRAEGYTGFGNKPLETTGHYDEDTAYAVNFFKIDNDIADDGMLGVLTNEAYDLVFWQEAAEQKEQARKNALWDKFSQLISRRINREILIETLVDKLINRSKSFESDYDESTDSQPEEMAAEINSSRIIRNVKGEIIGYNPDGEGYTIEGEAGMALPSGDDMAETPLTFATYDQPDTGVDVESKKDLEVILRDKIIERIAERHNVDSQTAQEMYDEDIENDTNKYGTFDGRILHEGDEDAQEPDAVQYVLQKLSSNNSEGVKKDIWINEKKINNAKIYANGTFGNATDIVAGLKSVNDNHINAAYNAEDNSYTVRIYNPSSGQNLVVYFDLKLTDGGTQDANARIYLSHDFDEYGAVDDGRVWTGYLPFRIENDKIQTSVERMTDLAGLNDRVSYGGEYPLSDGAGKVKLDHLDIRTPWQNDTNEYEFLYMGDTEQKRQENLQELNRTLEEFEINTPARIAFFLGQARMESRHGYRTVESFDGDDPKKYFNEKYSNRQDLGNNGGDDGQKYRGSGYIQLTGRYNYQRFSDYIEQRHGYDPDIINKGYEAIGGSYNRPVSEIDPNDKDVINIGKYAWKSAGWFWVNGSKYNLNELADKNDWYALAGAVQGSVETAYERNKYINQYYKILTGQNLGLPEK